MYSRYCIDQTEMYSTSYDLKDQIWYGILYLYFKIKAVNNIDL